MKELAESPLTGKPGKIYDLLSVDEITSAYRVAFGFDVSKYLPLCEDIAAYICPDSGLKYYGPEISAGPPEFYEALYSKPKSDWAYQTSKWEFNTALRMVSASSKLIDVGCGSGSFLEMMKRAGCNGIGLETSSHAVMSARSKGLEIASESVHEYSQKHSGSYDVVTLFQVLEHIDEPLAFLGSCIRLLKPKGKLILSVPNNDSFIRMTKYLPLNLPPHHVTRWNRESLEFLPSVLPIGVSCIECEPLQPHNIGWYKSVMERKYIPKNRLLQMIYFRIGGSAAFSAFLHEQCFTILGHTILASFVNQS